MPPRSKGLAEVAVLRVLSKYSNGKGRQINRCWPPRCLAEGRWEYGSFFGIIGASSLKRLDLSAGLPTINGVFAVRAFVFLDSGKSFLPLGKTKVAPMRTRYSVRSRVGLFESLEPRKLLAADIAALPDSDQAEVVSFSAADAVATRAAARIGVLEGYRQIRGTVGWFDPIDTIGFTLEQDSQFRADLTGLTYNADLYVTDQAGRLVGRSTRPGRLNDSIFGALESGTYYLHVVSQSFRSNQYTLSIRTAAVSPVPVPTASPSPSPGDSPPTEPSVSPLADVAYFGGSREWNLNAVGAPEAWAAGFTGAGVTVAVIDTGVDLDHPDLVSSLFVNPGEIPGNGKDDDQNGFIDDVHGYDFADNDADPNDLSGHGTHVAGTIAAGNNGFGATGVAPGAKILPVRVLGANGSGSSRDVAEGIRYAADLGADIINLSLGGAFSQAIERAIDYARELGAIVIASAGNEAASTPSYPARFSQSDSNVISVGAHDSAGRIAGFSNDVGASGSVQIDAPGVGVFSTYVGGGYRTLSGTSMAAPHVAGLAALTLSANPDLTSQELRDLLASGVVGRATGSDAIGSGNAIVTVAYAAAGFKTTGSPSASNSESSVGLPVGASSENSYSIRATSILEDSSGGLFSRRPEVERQSGADTVSPIGIVSAGIPSAAKSHAIATDAALAELEPVFRSQQDGEASERERSLALNLDLIAEADPAAWWFF